MAVNHYFQSGVPGQFSATQELYQRLINQSIQVTGFDVYYIPRTYVNVDSIFTEDTISTFDNAIMIEMNMKDVTGFEGSGAFMSKFGLDIQDQCTFVVSRERWEQEIGRTGLTHLPRPVEGDAIYFPMSKTLFEIKRVDALDVFYQLGKLFTYDLKCEVFQYSQEKFSTGISDLDNNPYLFDVVQEDFGINMASGLMMNFVQTPNTVTQADYSLDILDPIAQNTQLTDQATVVIDWTETNPFGTIK
jgi:hypothetical protein